jgi:hypothetical protein
MAIQSSGECNLCGATFSRQKMTRHLAACQPSAHKSSGTAFHLFVEARYDKAYWLHVALPANAALSTLDRFLRDIWLECCGHMSAFNINGMSYVSAQYDDFDEGERTMNVAACSTQE